ncbi:30S ribosomal protein S15 [Candidatus Nitrosopelagicus sp.]|jgi:small subunit ribosomal protein S15|uniref:Small ribosomal subunit protein uS15 n=2 Tax=environmental samples TaxID=651140 RepID=A0A075FZS3_9ARCH|nr:ribosomal protein S15P (RP-S15, rpsO) [uncultured marine thaumarchaeote AD1000_54_F09]AIF09040.1 ribosomal protein S15P (RP-S15, rpsO) [uncultured marine thaumarchaeote KM3_34_C02]MDB3956927.1 30S ribosomal protein S15 [Candidatus Nitrosopelagicus sp.]|tara:strand:+ start:628 stop:1077 length:450 start_codon:yes stop_codon:yes gene_type:complete
MGRLHTHNHGKSHSIRPIDPKKPDWVKQTNEEIEGLIIKYAKEGMTTSQIGIKLRDQHAIPLVKPIINKGIKEVLIENKLNPEIPEDLNNIVMKAVNLQKHLKENRSDNRNTRALELVEAKVHRLSTHYKKTGEIDQKWKYKSVVAQLE